MYFQNVKRAFIIDYWNSIVKLEKSYFIYKKIEWAEKNPRNFEMGTEGYLSAFIWQRAPERQRNIQIQVDLEIFVKKPSFSKWK